VCKVCGHGESADFNAAKNIAFQAAVNQPMAAGVLRRNVGRRTEPQAVC